MMHRMPTLNPRITITLDSSTAARLRRLSELTGDSQSKLVSEILDEAAQVFDRLIRVLEAAEAAKLAVKSSSAERLGEAQDFIEKQLGLVLGGFDDLTGSLLKEAEAIQRRAARKRPAATVGKRQRLTPGTPDASVSPAEALPTPMSNRGVRSTNPPTKNKNRRTQ